MLEICAIGPITLRSERLFSNHDDSMWEPRNNFHYCDTDQLRWLPQALNKAINKKSYRFTKLRRKTQNEKDIYLN